MGLIIVTDSCFSFPSTFKGSSSSALIINLKIPVLLGKLDTPKWTRQEHGIGSELWKESQANLNSRAKSHESLFLVDFIDFKNAYNMNVYH